MKIYYIANIRLPTEKAHGIQIMKMCEAFADLGREVELIVPDRKSHIGTDPFKFYSVKENFKIKILPSPDLVRFGRPGFLMQSFIFANISSWYLWNKNGLFYTRDELSALLLRMTGKKMAWEVHMGQMNIFARLVLFFGVPIVTITGKLKELYMKHGVPAEKIFVAPDAVDLKDFEYLSSKKELRRNLGLPADKFIISYIGKFKTMGKPKGVEDVVGPFADIYRSNTDVMLLIVGPDRAEVGEIETLLAAAKVPASAYTIIPHVERIITPQYLKSSDVLLMAYPNTTHYALYMSPLKLFEYMASGTPILASRLPSLEEILTDKSAYFFKPDDIQDFKEKLLQIMQNYPEAEKRGLQAAVDVREYTWGKRAIRILRFLGF